MDKIKEYKDKLNNLRPEEWEQIPDIALYMDQVIGYMSRQHIGLADDGEENLTSAMINNYVKNGLLPRAKGKRYGREHIGYLTAICLLKQVLSVSEAGVLLKKQMEYQNIEEFYKNYKEILNMEFCKTGEELPEDASDEELAQLALKMAVESYAQMSACKTILKQLAVKEEEK